MASRPRGKRADGQNGDRGPQEAQQAQAPCDEFRRTPPADPAAPIPASGRRPVRDRIHAMNPGSTRVSRAPEGKRGQQGHGTGRTRPHVAVASRSKCRMPTEPSTPCSEL
jgi:hypothetical protein